MGIALLAASLTVLFLGSRTVMAIGGSCATGGPYEVATPCPEGIAWMVPVSIFTGIIGLAVYGTHLLPVGPRMALLAWPALFLSLGWGFLEASLAAPGGVEWGFMVCAVIFALMGGLPLLALLNADHFKGTFWGPNLPPGARVVPHTAARDAANTGGPGQVRWTTSVELPGDRAWAGGDRSGTDGAGAQDEIPRFVPRLTRVGDDHDGRAADDIVSGLERLARLHESGHLDDAEYQAAKARLIEGGR